MTICSGRKASLPAAASVSARAVVSSQYRFFQASSSFFLGVHLLGQLLFELLLLVGRLLFLRPRLPAQRLQLLGHLLTLLDGQVL